MRLGAVGVVVAALLLVSGGLAPARAGYGSSEHWHSPTTRAYSSRIESHAIRYPVVGYSLPNGYLGLGRHAGDDFCVSRSYSNAACTNGTGHSGNDLYPTDGYPSWTGEYPPLGTLRVVAAYGGTVRASGCASGAGHYVYVDGNDGRHYRFLHLHPGTRAVSKDHSVRSGQLIGAMGASNSCSSNGAGHHLHFDTFKGGNNRATDAYDPYLALRDNFATPGRSPGVQSDGSTPSPLVDSRLESAWRSAINANGGYVQAISRVGWPSNTNYVSADPRRPYVYHTYGYYGRGYKQYLGNGSTQHDGRGWARSGALMRRDLSTRYGRWVHGLIWKRYSNMDGYASSDMEYSWLGYPISHEFVGSDGRRKQRFEGGCIVNDGGGYASGRNPYVPKSSSHSWCQS